VNRILGELVQGGPAAQAAAKDTIRSVARAPITPELISETAARIATLRGSEEGREGIGAFLEKRPPSWIQEFKRAGKRAKK
jgi:methylglutaconyl-CoA hydratase